MALQGAAKDSEHEHGDTQVLGENIPPRLEDAVLGVLLDADVSEFSHWDHPDCWSTLKGRNQSENRLVLFQGPAAHSDQLCICGLNTNYWTA